MLVLKFGGTSVSSLESIRHFSAILKAKNEPFIVVVSAMLKATDRLDALVHNALKDEFLESLNALKQDHFDLIHQLFAPANQTAVIIYVQQVFNELENICSSVQVIGELSAKTRARFLSFGEQLSAFILHKFLQQEKLDVDWLNSLELIRASGDFLNATVDVPATEKAIKQAVKPAKNYIAGGFIGQNNQQETVLLGRGGSDYSAALFAYALNARELEIWSDVSGMQTANPKIVSDTDTIRQMTYDEAFELAYFGAKVLYPPTIRPVMEKNIPVYLKNTLIPNDPGTLINQEEVPSGNWIKGVSSLSDICILNFSGVGLAQTKGSARKVFEALEIGGVNVILISQSCSEQSICIGIRQDEAEQAEQALNRMFAKEMELGLIDPVELTNQQAIVAVVGEHMKNRVGLSGKVLASLGENGINVRAIAQGASERNISIVVDKRDESKAIHVLHEQFFRDKLKKVHLFVAGTGNVGREFLRLVEQQHDYLMENFQLDVQIIGLCNSRKMLLKREGFGVNAVDELEKEGKSINSFAEFATEAVEFNLRNSVFVDNTASEQVSNLYALFLRKSISVVTCNKIACSSSYEQYSKLKREAREHNCSFRYETSVGAALPVIKTIQDLRISGDRIHRIDAVLSGSLNFIFNGYDATEDFASVVRQAKEEGYTEPDPLIDLSGLDVMRKILILARESGYHKEMNEISFNGFLPESCLKTTTVEAFFDSLKLEEPHFRKLYLDAHEKGNKLKVVATLDEGNLSVALREIEPESSFFNLKGKDNVIALKTDRYPDEPLIIKGAGAGAAVTASGVFSDLLLIVNN